MLTGAPLAQRENQLGGEGQCHWSTASGSGGRSASYFFSSISDFRLANGLCFTCGDFSPGITALPFSPL